MGLSGVRVGIGFLAARERAKNFLSLLSVFFPFHSLVAAEAAAAPKWKRFW